MIDLNLLHSFMEVAKTGNLSVAAKQLFLTQSALSQRIQNLEHQMGGHLFLRRKQGMLLNKSGTELLQMCKKLRTEMTQVDQWARARKNHIGGDITISTISSFISGVLPSVIRQFSEHHRGVRFAIEENVSADTEEAVLTGKADVGVISGACKKPSLQSRRLIANNDLLMVCAPSYLQKRKKITRANFREGSVIWYTNRRSRGIKRICQHLNISDQSDLGSIYLPGMETCKEYALQGLGVAFLAKMMVRRELTAGALVVVPGFKMTIPIHMVSRKETYEDPTLSRVKYFLEQHCRQIEQELSD